MQPMHSLRFGVPSPVTASHYDTRSAWLYLLCTHPFPKLMRIQMRGGLPAAAPGSGDSLPLPAWAAAVPLLVPFPKGRRLLLFSAPPPMSDAEDAAEAAAANASGGSWAAPRRRPALNVCRVRMDSPPPLSDGDGGCTQLRGRHALEEVLSASADEASGVAYVACRSGTALRLRVTPLRVEEQTQPLSSLPLIATAFRPSDGTLWLASASVSERWT